MPYPAPRDFENLARAVTDVQRDIADMAKANSEAREEANRWRSEMSRTLNGTVETVKRIEPYVWKHERWVQRAIGARMAFSAQWAIVVVIAGFIGYLLKELLPRLFK